MYKKCKIVMLPTDRSLLFIIDTSKMCFLEKERLSYSTVGGYPVKSDIYKPQHLYIISDDEIKEGDWSIDILNGIIEQTNKSTVDMINAGMLHNGNSKVIATTDTSLEIVFKGINSFYEKLPQISQQFINYYIEQYNKGNVIKEAEVEYTYDNGEIFVPMDMQYLYINSDNTINIKSIKDSWTRDEVISLCRDAFDDSCKYNNFKDWIEQNLK